MAGASDLRVHFTAAKPIAIALVAPTRYGNSHASRLKPRSTGAPSISSVPYFAMNAWMIVSCRSSPSRSSPPVHRASGATCRTDPCGTRPASDGRTRRRCRRSRAASVSRTASARRTTCACSCRRPFPCAERALPPSRTSSSTATVVAAASAGIFASANANDRSGSSATFAVAVAQQDQLVSHGFHPSGAAAGVAERYIFRRPCHNAGSHPAHAGVRHGPEVAPRRRTGSRIGWDRGAEG